MKSNRLVIFGGGEIAELAHFYFSHDSEFEVAGFCVDDEFLKEESFCGLPAVPLSRLEREYPPGEYCAHVALSYRELNGIRARKYRELKEIGYELPSYLCSKAVTWGDLAIGDNCFILENQTIQPTVKIGSNVMIWSGNHLGHGSSIGDHTYISSHVCISGHAKIGERCFFGVNSTTRDFVSVGDRVFVAMGASVVRDVEPDAVVVGARGTVFAAGSEKAVNLRRKYFGLES